MSSINGSSSSDHLSENIAQKNDFKFIVSSLKRTLTASDTFTRFIQLSSSSFHAMVMGDNLKTIQSMLLRIILKLLSSFKFKFLSLVDCNGLGRRPAFAEMLNQMEKFQMHDSHHWSSIITESKLNMDKFFAVNKPKYEDLVQFVHLTLDHLTRCKISLDLQTFAILFNTVSSTKSTTMTTSLLDFTPLTTLPGRVPSYHISVITSTDPNEPPKTPTTYHSLRCLSTHKRRLDFDQEEPALEVEYRLIPIGYSISRSYHRPENYQINLPGRLVEFPLEPKSPTLMDPRILHKVIIVEKSKKPKRFIHMNGTITTNIADSDEERMDQSKMVLQLSPITPPTIPVHSPMIIDYQPTPPSPPSPPISRPTKRQKIVWDLN